MKEALKKDWEYTLYEDGDGTHIVSVLCGGVAMYEVKIRLNYDEESEFEKRGEDFLNELAEDIRTNTSKYEDRFLGDDEY